MCVPTHASRRMGQEIAMTTFCVCVKPGMRALSLTLTNHILSTSLCFSCLRAIRSNFVCPPALNFVCSPLWQADPFQARQPQSARISESEPITFVTTNTTERTVRRSNFHLPLHDPFSLQEQCALAQECKYGRLSPEKVQVRCVLCE
jgi:hypothetical protein